MKVINDIQKPLSASSVVLLGNFDGLHWGHRKLINKAIEYARAAGSSCTMVTFDPHPQEVIRGTEIKKIYSQKQLVKELEPLGVDRILFQKFDISFSEQTAEDFFVDWLVKKIRPTHLIVGFNFRFGSKGEGSSETLKRLCHHHNIVLDVVDPVDYQGKTISSTWVRACLEEGNLDLAKELLSRRYFFIGTPEPGEQKGRQIGFPTINLSISQNIALKHGVYCTKLHTKDQTYCALSNLGFGATLKSKAPLTLESYVIEAFKGLGLEEVEVEFYKFIRSEIKFKSPAELKVQIQQDNKVALEFFGIQT